MAMTIEQASAEVDVAKQKCDVANLELAAAKVRLREAQESRAGISCGEIIRARDGKTYKISQVRFLSDGEIYGFHAHRQRKDGSFAVRSEFVDSVGYQKITQENS